jgi:hypothetical protein
MHYSLLNSVIITDSKGNIKRCKKVNESDTVGGHLL